MQHRDPTALAQALVAARLHHALLPADDWKDALRDAGDAYAVQDGVAAALGWFGHAAPRHWKSGGPSLATPLTHAPLPPAGVRASPASFADLPLHAPAIEAEIALRLSVDVDAARAAQLSAQDVESLVDAMTVSIEVVDSRWREGAQAPALLRLADLQSHGALALGAWVPFARRPWSAQRCEVRIGSQARVVRTGTHSLGDPAAVLPQWLQHATRGAATLPAGTVVTTGTWVGVLAARRGDEVTVAFDGIGSASLRL
jgi:2-keto-4-pentenoate hydratase